MNQIEQLCEALSRDLSSMHCPDCGKCHPVTVSHLKGETPFSASFPTLTVGADVDACACKRFWPSIRAIVSDARKDLMMRNGLL